MYNAHLDVVHTVLSKPEDEPKGKGKAVEGSGKGKGKAVEGNGKGKGKEVANGNGNGSAEPPRKNPYRQLQPEETPVTSAQRAAFTERVSQQPARGRR